MAHVAYQAILRANLVRIREQRGLSQEDLARTASLLGLRWLPVTVRAIESGRRKLSLGEAILLPALLDVPLSALAETDEASIDVQGVIIRADLWRALLPPAPVTSASQWLGTGSATARAGVLGRDRAVEAEAQNEAESKAARRLGIPGTELVERAHRLWGRGLTAERDRRLRSSTSEGEVRALRGHVTRVLMRELGQARVYEQEKGRKTTDVVGELERVTARKLTKMKRGEKP